jgi:guanylate kinase
MTPGPLFIVSGPSGTGKSTLIKAVIAREKFDLRLAVSATTRPARPGEENERDYHFWLKEKFEHELAGEAFLEHAIVHGEHYYGTPRSEVDPYRQQGIGVFLDIDVQGAAQVRRIYPEEVSVFVKLSRWEMYEERLLSRGSETPAKIARRLETAREELARIGEYRYVIVNDDLEKAVAELEAVVARTFQTAV